MKKRGPTQPFTHADDRKIVKADPDVQIEWSEVETGHWEAVCVCGTEYFHEPFTDDRDRLDPYDPSTSATRASASTATRPIPLCSGPS